MMAYEFGAGGGGEASLVFLRVDSRKRTQLRQAWLGTATSFSLLPRLQKFEAARIWFRGRGALRFRLRASGFSIQELRLDC